MNWTIIKNIGEFISDYTGSEVFGYVRLFIDVVLILAAIIFIYRIFMRYTNKRILFYLTASLLGLFLIIVVLDLRILYNLYPYIAFIVVVVWIFYNAGRLKSVFGDIVK